MSQAPAASFRDPALPLGARVDDLLGRLTLAEKLRLLHQHQGAVPRLGVDSFRTGTEALHGVAWLGSATVFPQAVGLASSWNTDLIRSVGTAIGEEVRAFHHKDPTGAGLNVWAPVVNPLRDPRWGRNEEGYSEDPWLTGEIAVAYCEGLIGDDPRRLRTAPTLKHFLAYNNETDRCVTSSSLPPRVLYDYDLPAFKAPLQAGVAFAIMPSYNLVNGRPAHLSPLINDLVRTWTDHDLLFVSDAGAPANLSELQGYFPDGVTAYAASLKAGVDSFTQDDADYGPSVQKLEQALADGLLAEGDIDRAARRALELRFRLGEFDPVSYDDVDPEVVNSPAHQALAREAATQSIVLLKSECCLLPLRPDLKSVAVIGPLADTLYEDWYSGTLPYQVTARAGLTERFESVTYCEGLDRIALKIDGGAGYLAAAEAGQPLTASPASGPDCWFDLFDWGGGAFALRSVRNQRHLSVNDAGEVVDDQPGPNGWEVKQTFALVERTDGSIALRHLNSGRFVTLDSTGSARLQDEGADPLTIFTMETVVDGAAQAAEVAAAAEVAIVVVGNHPLVNGRETEDRADLDLPAAQDRLVRAVHAANRSTVLVMSSSYPFSTTWAQQHLPAILWSSHGGQEYGHALADVLLGTVDPAGRLPQTWYRSAADLPDLLDYDIIGADATYLYYRGTPLYPFGFGLSYTTFEYGDLRLSSTTMPADGEVAISVRVTNTGDRAGTEVVQLYTHQQRSRAKQPLRQLRGFRRVELEPGESVEVELTLRAADLAFWDVTRDRPCVETARHSILIGRSATDLLLSASIDVQGERIPARDVRRTALAATSFDHYCAVTLADASPERGDSVHALEAGSWIAFDDVDLGPGSVTAFTARVARDQEGAATLTLRLDDPLHGTELGTIDVAPTGHRHNWLTLAAPLPEAVSGTHTLYVVFSAEGTYLDNLTFEPTPGKQDLSL
ncbi:glycoside hydrolase family 3 protein [Kribbella deserti]|uniref:Glycoside hydrolase family 3 C-terminal domain-containing protein n=1 Tax=Kribbella deserti TaxID=1926257 RepID=A0ABV6QIP8_9ACTN